MIPRFYNTLTRAVEPFAPLDPDGKTVRMYTCGPTVYNFATIGNFRAYVFEDLLQRHLEYRGYRVLRAMNLTDVDDKTIRGARAANIPLGDFTRPFKEAFFADLEALRIKPANYFPAATDPAHIARMIEMIRQLVAGGYAYQADDGSVYFRLGRFPAYGRLAHLDLAELRPTGRVHSDEYDKEHIGDFALWKAWAEADGAVGWDSPWGRGRPGWHIECSAMATALLGPRLDLHCGGVDNIFPHHEAEIAQSECCTGQPFVRYWLHCAHLIVDGRKMSKSLGNYFTLRDLLGRGYSGREIRYTLLAVNYRLPLNFTFDGLAAARGALARLDEWLARLTDLAGPPPPAADQAATRAAAELPAATANFAAALDDDLNIAAALGSLFDVIRDTNRAMDAGALAAPAARSLLAWWQGINAILALAPDAATLPPAVAALLERRAQARAAKDWATSDTLRQEIGALGWEVKDARDGQKISPAAPPSPHPQS